MATTTVTLTPAQATQLEGLIAQGHFASTEAALARSLELLMHEVSTPSDLTEDEIALLVKRLEQGKEGNFVSQGEAQYSPRYTSEELDHLRRGLEQAEQGVFVSQEEVEALFETWQAEAGE